MRKLVCLMFSILLFIAMSVPAFAAETTQSDVSVVSDGGDGTQNPPSGETTHTHTWSTVTTPATCTQEGTKTDTCSGCGAVNTETLPATGHSFGGWEKLDDSSHQHACTVCGAIESAAHSWSETQVTPATCLATGSKSYACGCGATKTETLPIGSHSYGDWVVGESTHSHTCSVCGKAESGDHSFGVTATVPATCKEEGATAYGCTVCGGIVYEILPKLTTHTYDNACDPDCNVCGATRDAAHKFSTVWSKNFQGHWHACTVCGAKADMGSHYPGPAATEEKAQICLTCGYTLTAKLNHVHKYDTQWSSDETGHWYACSGCDEQKNFEEHTYDDPCDPDCNVCGYISATAHSYDGTWLSDESGHWAVCTLCGEKSETEAHIPGPEATEDEAQLCTACGFEMAPAQEHVHEAGEEWLTDEERHWHECECGEKMEEALHTWDEGTENEDTTITYVCTECQAEKIEGEPKEKSGFPWWIAGVAAVLACGGGVAAFLLLRPRKKSGRFTK